MSKSRPPLLLIALGVILVGISGIVLYMNETAAVHQSLKDVPSVRPSEPGPKWASAVAQAQQIAHSAVFERNLPGLSVAVGIGGDIVWAEGFGFADLDSHVPVTPKHRFRIGTASTALASAAAGLLVQDGRLKLDEEIQRYVPQFPKKQWPVLLKHIMGHTSGLRNDGGDEGPLFAAHCGGPREALRHFADYPLLFEPGTKYRYSNYGWILVSAAIETASGQPFLTYMQRNVFDPLGMMDTLADKVKEPAGERVTSYFPRFAADPAWGLHVMRDLDLSCYAGSSVFLSTPSDLVRFGMAVQGGKLLRRDTVRMLQTSQRLTAGTETGYGLGWDLETVKLGGKDAQVVGHDGELLGGMVASLITFPDRDVVVALASNISYADTFSLGLKIAEAFAPQR